MSNDDMLEGIKQTCVLMYQDNEKQLIAVENEHLKLLKRRLYLNRLLLSKSIEQFLAIKTYNYDELIDIYGKACKHEEDDEGCDCI